ncbi:hypothetical protein [Kineosporia babensis]|uniref:Secreted protein n=1 Tax=Kineosporia babensis TaxID=499548 RepID=A0A9X1NF79_9ACTN|nr:hypothetical protein [Kineosporia babensis]MCD5313897.1 hypothetical protein [Kineosporia babensis]
MSIKRILSLATATSGILALSVMAAPTAMSAPRAVGDIGVDCVGQVNVQKSETYGIMAVFGAQCDRNTNVNVKARIFVNGKLKKTSALKKCRSMKQDAYCQSYVTAANPSGKQKVRVELVNSEWWLTGESQTRGRSLNASTTADL